MGRKIISVIVIWALLNLLGNSIGIILQKMLSDYDYQMDIEDIGWVASHIGIQSLYFSVLMIPASLITQNIQKTLWSFIALQAFLFHFILIDGIIASEDGFRFVSSDTDWGLYYLQSHGQNLVGVLNEFYPVEGIFSCGIFSPNNLFVFYIEWVFGVIIYYLLLSTLTFSIYQKYLQTK